MQAGLYRLGVAFAPNGESLVTLHARWGCTMVQGIILGGMRWLPKEQHPASNEYLSGYEYHGTLVLSCPPLRASSSALRQPHYSPDYHFSVSSFQFQLLFASLPSCLDQASRPDSVHRLNG
jgi:hypothetical protein